MKLEKYSIGIGDRFHHEISNQLKAIQKAWKDGTRISPVWNKSFREYQFTGSKPKQYFDKISSVIEQSKWPNTYFIDADHINFDNVDHFIPYCNYFTIDITNKIGVHPYGLQEKKLLDECKKYIGRFSLPGLNYSINFKMRQLRDIVCKYYEAIKEAGKIYRLIEFHKKGEPFITEISIDETEEVQSPAELFIILKMIAEEDIPINLIAPKLPGVFNKGVDWEGDIDCFKREFEELAMVLKKARKHFRLPVDLKLSIHTGSDKYSIYPAMNDIIKKHDLGIHLKTAGTTWLEEVRGLINGDPDSLSFVKAMYKIAYNNLDQLLEQYNYLSQINRSNLPNPSTVNLMTPGELDECFVNDPTNPKYNKDLRQVFHLSYKIAAQDDLIFFRHLQKHKEIIGSFVYDNIYAKHIIPLFY